MTEEIIKYQKGQKVPVPREMRPMLEKMIAQREQWEAEAFREIGEAFGYGGKDIHKDQKWMFAIDKPNRIAFCFLKGDEEAKRIKEIPIEQAMNAIMKLEAAKPTNQLVVNCIEMLIEGAEHYIWRLLPAEMVIEITDRKHLPEKPEIDLSAVANQGGVQ